MKICIDKRDGREELFNREKIEKAVEKAFIAVDGELTEYAKSKASNIASFVEEKAIEEKLSVEKIQDLVENGLMSTKRKDVAIAYHDYRRDRSIEREKRSSLMKNVAIKLSASNVQNQNANVDEFSFGGRMGEACEAVTKQYALYSCMSKQAVYNHIMNIIYTHDLGSYAVGMHNCLSIPYDDLLKNGFNTRQTDVRGAKSVNTALQLIAVIAQLQSLNQFGGVSATHLDHTLVPYVRMSFIKHYITEYLKDIDVFYELDLLEMDAEDFDWWIDEHKEEYFKQFGLNKEDFRFDNKENLNKKYYQAALFETRKEIYQAVEALYHNLNTLQSRSGRIDCPTIQRCMG